MPVVLTELGQDFTHPTHNSLKNQWLVFGWKVANHYTGRSAILPVYAVLHVQKILVNEINMTPIKSANNQFPNSEKIGESTTRKTQSRDINMTIETFCGSRLVWTSPQGAHFQPVIFANDSSSPRE
jgi:hypothetical protein